MKSREQIVEDAGYLLRVVDAGEDGFRGFLRWTGTEPLQFIASWGLGWDHVSVSLSGRCPTWKEMSFVKDIFFEIDETAMQLHVPYADHVNCHTNCLHLWRPQNTTIPRPPAIMVGPVRLPDAGEGKNDG